ncbi:hypothetical protein [Weissella confusa]|uniref:hypothetical protein n=1 Tax=Weissella confusa TaxID=1583 RepID=UPI003B211130
MDTSVQHTSSSLVETVLSWLRRTQASRWTNHCSIWVRRSLCHHVSRHHVKNCLTTTQRRVSSLTK